MKAVYQLSELMVGSLGRAGASTAGTRGARNSRLEKLGRSTKPLRVHEVASRLRWTRRRKPRTMTRYGTTPCWLIPGMKPWKNTRFATEHSVLVQMTDMPRNITAYMLKEGISKTSILPFLASQIKSFPESL